MNWNHVERMWKQAKGKVQEKWDKRTDDDLQLVDGADAMVRTRSNNVSDHVRKEIDDWVRWQAPVIHVGADLRDQV